MKQQTKDRLMAFLLFVSLIGLFVISFIDYNQRLKIFQFGNPLADEDWILTILSLIGFIISFRYTVAVFKRLGERKESLKEKIASQIKEEYTCILLIGLFFLVLVLAFFDFVNGKTVFDPLLFKDEDIAVAVLSLFGITKFVLDYIKLKK